MVVQMFRQGCLSMCLLYVVVIATDTGEAGEQCFSPSLMAQRETTINNMLQKALKQGFEAGMLKGVEEGIKRAQQAHVQPDAPPSEQTPSPTSNPPTPTHAQQHNEPRAHSVTRNHAPLIDDITYEFATPVLDTLLLLPNEHLAALRTLVLDKMEASTGRNEQAPQRSTKGTDSWHSGEILDWQSTEIAALGNLILAKLHRLLWLEHDGHPCVATPTTKCLGKQNATFHVAMSMWANVLGDGGYNTVHSHNVGNTMTQHWSGVFYIETPPSATPNGGLFEYFDTRGDMFPLPYNRLVEPKPKRLITFPAYLKHSVRPFFGKGRRISISFNLDVQSAFASNRPRIICINCNWGGAEDDQHGQAPGGMRVRPVGDRPSMMNV